MTRHWHVNKVGAGYEAKHGAGHENWNWGMLGKGLEIWTGYRAGHGNITLKWSWR